MTKMLPGVLDDCNMIRVDSLLIHKNLVLHHVERVIADAKAATRNRFAFSEVGLLASQLDATLRLLGAKQIASQDVVGCTLLHQVRYAMMDTIALIDQYEDPEFPNDLVFTEPYNAQLNRVVQRLRVLVSAVQQRVDDFDALLLKYHNDRKQTSREAPVDYAASCLLSAAKTSASLSAFLEDCNATAVGTVHPILQSAACGCWNEVEHALHQEPSLSMVTNGTFSLLHMAVLWQSPHAVALVLGFGADINCQTAKDGLLPAGSTAVHLATTLGNAAVLKLLLCWGANSDVCDRTGQRPAALATSRSCRTQLEAAPHLRARSMEVCSAAQDGQLSRLLTLLTKYDVAVNVKCSSSSSSFLIHQVASGGDPDAYWLLLEAGASPLLRSRDKQLPSDVARSANHAGLVVELMQKVEELEKITAPDPPRRQSPTTLLKVPEPGPVSLPCSPTSSALRLPSNSPGHRGWFNSKESLSKLSAPGSIASKGSFSGPGSPLAPLRDAVSLVATKLKGRIHHSPASSPKSARTPR